MEEMMMMTTMMMMMMIRSSSENPSNESLSDEPISTSTFPTWKLYENPFYYSQQPNSHHHHHQLQQQTNQEQDSHNKQLHRLNLPISARKIAASFWDLTFIRPVMESELDIARAQIIELKADLEYERKTRKKMESMNKRLARELSEDRKGREALERVCEELAKEISSHKAEINRMKKDMEEERKMLRMAEVIREERVQMKLTDAKLFLEEKILELEETKQIQKPDTNNGRTIATHTNSNSADSFLAEAIRSCAIGGEKSSSFNVENNINNGIANPKSIQRKASPEPQNPHIKRGIKGFVEFPKVVRAIGSKSRHLGTKLECQKAQLRILLKQKNPIRSSNLIMS
ncbi:hypothetical protein ACSBR2_023129 [Camellia fascicularis]